VALERAQQLGAQLPLALGVARLHRLQDQLVEAGATAHLLEATGGDAHVELAVQRLAQRGEVPVLGMGLLGGEGVQRAGHHVLHPLRDGVGLALAVEDLAAHAVD